MPMCKNFMIYWFRYFGYSPINTGRLHLIEHWEEHIGRYGRAEQVADVDHHKLGAERVCLPDHKNYG